MADKLGVPAAAGAALVDDAASIMALLERVAGIIDGVQATQLRMEERQQELETTVKTIQTDVTKLTGDHAATSATVDRLLEKTRKVSCHIKDVRVRVENQNLRVKRVEVTQLDLLAKNKFKVVIYQGEQEVKSVAPPSQEPAEARCGSVDSAGSGGAASSSTKVEEVEPDKFEPQPDSDEEYVVVEEAADPLAPSAASTAVTHAKKSGLKRIESFKANMAKTRENLGTKVNKLGERIVTAERREKIRQSGERLKQSGERLKESIAKSVPAKLKKERTVAEGQEGAEGVAAEADAPVPPPKGARKGSPEVAAEAADDSKVAEEAEVPMYDMKQLA